MTWHSNRRHQLPPDWPTIRRAALDRDGWLCQGRDQGKPCTYPATEVHHLRDGHDHSLANLQSLCRWHHARETAREASEARARRPTDRRQAEPHPGEL